MTKKINDQIFRAYDIRGVYPRDLDEDVAERVGRAFAGFIGPGRKVLVGRDVRQSSPSLASRLTEAILNSGLDIVYAGVIPTPLLYFAISHYGLDGGITVSASHNPPQWNGFKMCKKGGYAVGKGSGMEMIKELADRNDFMDGNRGVMEDRSAEIMGDYIGFVSGKVGAFGGLRIGIDPGNGAYSQIASEAFRRKGAEVHAINDTPDGNFPSRSPEPTASSITALVELVKSRSLDLGIAFDGDGDRVLFVTDRGVVLGGDQVLALLIRQYLKRGEKVAYEVSCSSVVEDMLRERGGVPLLTKVGHSYFKDNMKNEGCRFGGEISGHMYFQETYGGDDGLFAGMKVADMLVETGKKFSELFDQMPRYVKVSREFEVDDKEKFRVMERIAKSLSTRGYRIIDIDGVKAITEDGWFVIRASNTGPMIKMSVEASDERRVMELVDIAVSELKTASAHST